MMYLAIKIIIILTKSSDIRKTKIPRVQKRRGQEEPATKSSDINYGQELCEQIRDLKL